MKTEFAAIEFSDVSKTYYRKGILSSFSKKVLDRVSFSVAKGSITGLVGLNGAGKTTIIKIICGITKPDSGSVKVMGFDLSNKLHRKNIGYTSELPYFCQSFSVDQTIRFFHSISYNPVDENKLKEIYMISGVESFKKEKVKNLSRGMLQKLSLACALVSDPEILVLDEPTGGLDPLYVKTMREMLLKINKGGKTIFFSSHTISEVEKICNAVIVINRGRIIKVFDDRAYFKDNLERLVIESIEKDV